MRVIFIFLLALVTTAQAQQINPVPDYIFRNQMSVGRNGVTDTAAYMSVGPRFGANKGMMPPMVVDTNTVTGSKRNGLFIFSVQKNKYVYWDSVGAKWAEMAGTGGTAINSGDTAAMLLPYIRHAGYGLIKIVQALSVDTSAIATRLRVQKGIDSVATLANTKVNISDTATMLTNYTRGSGTANYIPKWQGTRGFVNSLVQDNGNAIGVGVTPKTWATVTGVQLGTGGSFTSHRFSSGNNQTFMMNNLYFDNGGFRAINTDFVTMFRSVNDEFRWEIGGSTSADAVASLTQAMTLTNAGNLAIGNTSPAYKLDISGTLRNTTGAAFATSSGNVLIGKTVDAGVKLDVVGNIANTTGANFATSSGNVGIGNTTPSEKLHVTGRIRATTIDSTATGINMLYADANGVIKKAAVPTGGGLSGTGISGYFPKWTGSTTQDTSQIRQVAGDLGIGDAPIAGTKLSVYGKTFIGNNLTLSTSGSFGIYSQHDLNELSMALVARRDPLGADTILSAVVFGSNTYQAPARIQAISSQSWTGGDRGIYLSFRTTPNDSTLTEEAMRLNHDGEMQAIKGIAFKSSSEAIISANYTVLPKDYFVFLPDLEGASRNIVLPNNATPGRVLIIFNSSSDGTYKWTFTGEDVEDASGAAITTLTDQKSYTLIYFGGKFRVTAIN